MNADGVDVLAAMRSWAGANITGSARRFEALADAMRQADAETVAAVARMAGLAALQGRLRTARRPIANRDCIERLADRVDRLDASPDLAAARDALSRAEAQLAQVSCRVCDEGDPLAPIPFPFGNAAERGKWAAAHTKGTGHDRWVVWEETRDVPDLD